ncbi:MAG TPA: alpha/beta hydrolase [Caulobacteraceae bacterium]|nr:alpha/beta hydrolase [Caulobacteraceae bacterium]
MADDPSLQARAGEQEEILLWPQGPPGGASPVGPPQRFRAPAAGGRESAMLRNVGAPTLSVYRPDPARANGVGVIVCPGGGWRILAVEHEGQDLARWLAERGYAAFLLKYRLMATPADPAEFAASMAAMASRLSTPLPAAKAARRLSQVLTDPETLRARDHAAADGRRALALVRERAGEWGVTPDRIGMVGFSAGAFLAADVAMESGGAPLAFVAPIYGGETGGRPVAADAPPLFTVVAADDRMLFKVVEGLYADWSNADRPAELHVFARGGHGFGMARQGLPADRWIDLFEAWLGDRGFA